MGYKASERTTRTSSTSTSSRVTYDGRMTEDSSQNTTNYYTSTGRSSSSSSSRDIFNNAVNYIQKNAAPYVKKGAKSLQKKGGESFQKSAQSIQEGVTKVVNSVAAAAEAKSSAITQSNRYPVVIKRKVKRSLIKKGAGNFMISFGAFWFLMWGISIIECLAGNGSISLGIFSVVLAALNAGLVFNGIQKKRNAERFRRYLSIIQGRHIISLEELSQRSSIGKSRVISDLRKMEDGGLLGTEAEIDVVYDILILTKTGRSEADNLRKNSDEMQRRSEIAEGGDDSEKQILILEELSANINDAQMASLVSELASLSKKIIAHKEESTEDTQKLYMFLSYYLPTTVKLAKKYDELEKQNVPGKNITSIMENIRESLSSTRYAFVQKLDGLYSDDMLDINSDISVMEQMLAREGITGKKKS